ncbi:nitrilase [Geosmithia morbida]|uniref:Nitrilase n=1 Tax=Geosmithia morbida TaxID=1094350 RepID=A0A9P5D169_9HYPO|nr:nitrilase [Geosmithia morbida]KAF4119555.1 nitrilase [Geosmithia morbida]
MGLIRLATASPGTQPTTASTLELLRTVAQQAASQGADLLLLPEAFLGGYPRGSGFGSVVGSRSAEGRDEFARYFEAAVDLGDTAGPGGAGAGDEWIRRELPSQNVSGNSDVPRGDGTREYLESVARDTGVFIVTGCVEKAGGSLYCAAVYVCPTKGIIGKRRKVMPTGTERLIWAQASPATLRAVSTTIKGVRVNMAAAICWESYMPLLRQALYAQNINLYLAPTADARDAWLGLMRTVAIEGRCFVVSSNMAVRDTTSASIIAAAAEQQEEGHQVNGTAAPKVPASSSSSWICRGGSSIVDPMGEVLAGPQWEDEHSLIYADVDLRDCIKGRLDFDVAGSYSRSDSFKFSVEGLNLDPLPY